MISRPREKRVAIVTGAGGLIGGSIARTLAADGYQVVLVDRSELIHEQANALSAQGFCAAARVVNVASEGEIHAFSQDVRTIFGGADALVNNAGIMLYKDDDICPIDAMSLDQWNTVMTVNMSAAFLMCREFLPAMKASGWGRIVNMTSRVARTYVPGVGADYAASKAALAGFTRILAGETARFGITANCVAPGRVSVSMGDVMPKEKEEVANRRIPMRRAASPDEVASAVSYLLSERASYITGATIDVNGGGFMS